MAADLEGEAMAAAGSGAAGLGAVVTGAVGLAAVAVEVQQGKPREPWLHYLRQPPLC